uniref:Uncharacterized protein n=1 Tax=Candidatus Giovannonibacteria bacterium GW2011_GWF2_42_19 TaxID=1618659 RepID=A0A0G0ZFN7_9BACT|nr:MAG: hypothetical protein UV11_C0015G0001 [Candidatus Giovannonibacteria bacterium GW2011_GWF2_42_19]
MRQFGNPVFLVHKQKKVYENYHHYYGVLALRVRKSSRLKYEILGLIDALKKSNIAKVAQWLERSFHKRQVVGSIPTLGTCDLYPKKWTQAQFSFVSINN